MKKLLIAVAVISVAAVAVTTSNAGPTGCRGFVYQHKQLSRFHTTVLFRMYLRVDVCYSNDRVTTSGASCWTDDVYTATVDASDCTVSSYRFGWNGNELGAFHAQGSARFTNCIILPHRIGCVANGAQLTLIGDAYADGTFSGSEAY